ncbi:MAG: beta-galactosidase, partial [Armatimonadetes bacterium]|nr:beta-galactosidase [Armatimonadota bacterium]
AYVTPHVAWANPYYRGKTHLLVIAPMWSQRETIELAQRLSVDFTPWMSATFKAFVTPAQFDPAFQFFQAPPEVAQRAGAEALKKDYDVILVGKQEWSSIPGKQRFELLKRVAEGCGFVYVNPPKGDKELDLVFSRHAAPEGAAFITSNLPLAVLPRFERIDRDKLVTTCLFGKGRVVVLDYREPPMPKEEWESCAWPCLTPQWDLIDTKDGFQPLEKQPEAEFVPYEYYQALVAKAVLWAGKKEPEVTLKRISIDEKVPWPAAGKRVLVEGDHMPPDAVTRVVVRNRKDGHTALLGVKKATDKVSFALPDLPTGDYFVDAWILTPGGKETLTWGSRSFTVTADSPFGEIVLDQKAYNRRDWVSGRVSLVRSLQKNEKIKVNLWDNHHRLVESRLLQPAETTAPFRFAPLRPLTSLYRVEAQLVRDGKVVCESSLAFPVRARLGWDDFNDIVWSGGENNFLTHLMLRKLSTSDEATAIDIGWRGNTNARNLAMANLASLPYTARYGCLGAGPDHIVAVDPKTAYGCMSDPTTLANLDKWGDIQSQMFGPYGPLAWTHGDETNYAYGDPNLCWSRTCLAAFRTYLKGVYFDLEAVNREWGTGCKSWDEVMPLAFQEAKETKGYARWIEHRLSSNRVFAEFYHKSGEALSKNDPGARAGFDGGVGLDAPNSGGDWWTLSRNIGILQSYMYDSAQMEMIRSFARPNQVRGMWYGTYGLSWQIGPNTPTYCHFFPWYSLFHQLNTTWFWTMGAPGPLAGYAPDLASLPFFEARTEALKSIRSGVGKLLLSSARLNDGIAIHHSEVSRIADSLFAAKDSDWCSGYSQAVASFNKVLEDIGLQYQYVATSEIEKGALAKQSFKVLVMPHSRAVSEAEAKEIRKFVQNGGVLLADLLPGTLNGHGTPQTESLLADLFPSDKPETVTTVGKGKTVLIGNLLEGYSKAHLNQFGWKRLPVEKSQRLAALLRENARVAPQVKVIPLKTDRMPPTEITRFQCGEIQFVGLLREYFLYDNEPYRVRIEFPRKAHLYDVMTGKYLGFAGRTEADLSYRAALYALSPYKVSSLEVTPSSTAVAGAPMTVQISVNTGGAEPSRHVLRVEVVDPNGKDLTHYAQNLLSERGRAKTAVPWALNDKPGRYTIVVRDAMSGITVKRAVNLKQEGQK